MFWFERRKGGKIVKAIDLQNYAYVFPLVRLPLLPIVKKMGCIWNKVVDICSIDLINFYIFHIPSLKQRGRT